jgi:uncharacterized protein (UPF0262 family)
MRRGIKRVTIDDALWEPASRLRRDDWRITIADLIDDASLGDEADDVLHVGLTGDAVLLATFDEDGAPQKTLELPLTRLRAHIDEYLAVINRMQHADAHAASAHMHSLDMAKKVVHDAGAKALARELPTLARDHETFRRLFSLVLALVVDVTAVPGARAHRGHSTP